MKDENQQNNVVNKNDDIENFMLHPVHPKEDVETQPNAYADIEIPTEVYDQYASGMDGRTRAVFIAKVYFLLSVQIIVTMVVVTLNMFIPVLVEFNIRFFWVSIILSLCCLPFLIALIFLKKKFPFNFILLFAFTLFFSWPVGMICSLFEAYSVLLVFFVCLGIMAVVTVIVCVTKANFSWCRVGLFLSLLALTSVSTIGIVFSFVLRLGIWWHYLISAVGAVLFTFYLIYDTSVIVNTHRYDEYIAGAVSLYLDIMGVFIRLLALAGKKK